MGEVPTGVKVISVLYYIGAVLNLLLVILFFSGAFTNYLIYLSRSIGSLFNFGYIRFATNLGILGLLLYS